MKQKHFFKNAVVQSVVLNKTSTYQKCPTILSKNSAKFYLKKNTVCVKVWGS